MAMNMEELLDSILYHVIFNRILLIPTTPLFPSTVMNGRKPKLEPVNLSSKLLSIKILKDHEENSN